MWKLALILVLVYAALAGCVYLAQERLIYFPYAAREHATTPAAHGLPFEDVAMRTEDGETLHAWWVPAAKARGTVLHFHGNAGNISHRIDYARMFQGLGYNTLLVDYRGYGRSTGSPSEAGTYKDADASRRWLIETRGLRDGDIVIFGESLGGAVGCWLAAKHTPHALILASTFTSVPDMAAEMYGFLPVRLMSRFKYNTRECVAGVNAPVLVAHSPADDIVPYAHGQRIYAAAREPKAFLDMAGGHNTGFVFMQAEWVNAVGAFLEKASKAKGDR